ncbi:PREDICTED: transmembrane protein 92-like [Chrysochloris asiatica]|uniref:Transmembrane protein 92-like n=1 Tax=Chrysochloris asiatica TaxID=185453 RepID=A0A9B0T0N7_CHRAS|nr:PREDICTED: transmembrane protein 92-like [Chrysochloris asiatica]
MHPSKNPPNKSVGTGPRQIRLPLGPVLTTYVAVQFPGLQERDWKAGTKCCLFFTCPEGFKCCGNSCGKEYEISNPLRIFSIFFLMVLLFLSICGLAKYFFGNCRKSEPGPLTELQGPPALPFITLTQLQSPPGSSSLRPHTPTARLFRCLCLACLLPPTHPPIEPPSPHSFRPEEHSGVHRGINNPAF